MEVISTFFKRSIPVFFESLPIPESFFGFADLTVKEWFEFVVFCGGLGALSYATYDYTTEKYKKYKQGCCGEVEKCPVNVLKMQPGVEKVVDFLDIEDVAEKVSYCRCWRSKKFPLCDGSHNAHNKENNDNVGPVVIRHKPQ